MYHFAASTASLPIFPGHYPATPAKARPQDLLDDIAQGAYSDNEQYETAYSEEDGGDALQDDSPDAPSLSLGSTCSSSIIEPQSTAESEDQDASSISESDASTINRTAPSQFVDQTASSLHFRLADLPSIRSEVSTSFPTVTNQQHPAMSGPPHRNGAHCPSSLSLDVDLVGFPEVSEDVQGVFLDGESDSSLHYYGVDLSCLSQPDGTNAWTLSLGATSPFPSISASDDTPQTGFTPTFSSPDASTTTHEPESADSSDAGTSPSLSVNYYGVNSTTSTPAYQFNERQIQIESSDHYAENYTDSYGEPSPPYEAEPLVLEPIPYQQPAANAVAQEPRSHFKEVLGDMKKFGNKLKKIFRAKPQLTFKGRTTIPPPTEAVTNQEPEVGVDYYEYPAASTTSVQTILNRRGDYALRTPPGLLGYVQEVEEEEGDFATETTPRLAESRRKLLKPQTTAEIKHIRRRTLPAAPLSNDWPSVEMASPIINLSQRRPRPRSLVFNMAPAGTPTLDTSYTSSSSTRSPLYEGASYTSASSARSPPYGESQLPAALPGTGELGQGGEAIGTTRRRKRWSTGLPFFSRS